MWLEKELWSLKWHELAVFEMMTNTMQDPKQRFLFVLPFFFSNGGREVWKVTSFLVDRKRVATSVPPPCEQSEYLFRHDFLSQMCDSPHDFEVFPVSSYRFVLSILKEYI